MPEVFDGFEQRADADIREPCGVAPARQSGQPGEVHDFQHVAGCVRHRDDVVAECPGTDFRLHTPHDIEHLERLARACGQRGPVERGRRPGKCADQQPLSVRLVLRGIVRLNLQHLQQFTDGLGMAAGFLADIEVHEIETEGLDQPHEVFQFGVGHVGIAVGDQ